MLTGSLPQPENGEEGRGLQHLLLARPRARLEAAGWSWRSIAARRIQGMRPPIVYLGDNGWVLYWVGHYLAKYLRDRYAFHVSGTWNGFRGTLVHFGSSTAFFGDRAYQTSHPSNTAVVTWFHGRENNPSPGMQRQLANVQEGSSEAAKIVYSCEIGGATLRQMGADEAKMVHIPLGVDSGMFRPPSPQERAAIRKEFEIPDDAVCVGSFHKDGDGWGEGMSPKWVKAPDVLIETLSKLSQTKNIVALLTGPARGFVKRGLERAGVPYRHVVLDSYNHLPKQYWALDLYVIPSRDEGGPMGLLEAMASGVPVVSTRVGMPNDLIENRHNGLMTEIDDVDGLAEMAANIVDDRELEGRIVAGGAETVAAYDWRHIAQRYHRDVYEPLLRRS